MFLVGNLAIYEQFVRLFVHIRNKNTLCYLSIKEFTVGVKKKLLDIVRDKIRFKHYSMSTEKTYTFSSFPRCTWECILTLEIK